MFRNTGRYSELPQAETGYELDPYKSFFSIVLPTGVDKTNICINPSLETNITGWAAFGTGAVAQSAANQIFGLNSLLVTPGSGNGNGALYGSGSILTLTTGIQYFISVYFKGSAGLKYQLSVATSGGTVITGTPFTATGFWQRATHIYAETATNARLIVIQKSPAVGSADVIQFNVDGLQIETSEFTTYIDGDQVGFVRNRLDYYWVGTPHGSTSVRIGQSRHGGKVIALADFGFRVAAILGLGMAGRINQMMPIAKGGAFYSGSTVSDRQFALTGMLYGNGLVDLQRKRKQIIDIIKDDVVSPDQPLKLIYQQTDEDGNIITPQQEIVAVVDGDPMVGHTDNYFTESVALTFRLFMPYVMQETGNTGASIGFQSTLTNADYTVYRSPNDVWSTLNSHSFNGPPFASIIMPNGDIIVGGGFTTAGVANTNGIARYSNGTWNAMGTGMTGNVYAMALGPDGSLYVGGDFLLAGGVPNTVRIAKWDGSVWSALGTGASSNTVRALAFDTAGNLWAGGDYLLMGGVANAIRLAYWGTDLAWHAYTFSGIGGIAGGASPTVQTLAPDSAGRMYVGGAFTLAGGVGVSNITRVGVTSAAMNTTQFGGGITGGGVDKILIAPDGTLYAGGVFTNAGTVTAAGLAKWNGNSWSVLGSGLSGGTNVYTLAWDPVTNSLWIGGFFTSAGGISTPAALIRWNGSNYLIPDITLPGGTSVWSIFISPTGQIILGYDSAASPKISSIASVSNTGSAAVGFTLKLTGPGIVYGIQNINTGKSILFNLTLQAGETAILDMSSYSNITFVSSIFGSLLNKILAGSSPVDFVLASGVNSIAMFIGGTTTAATTASITWRNTHHSIDGAIPIGLGL